MILPLGYIENLLMIVSSEEHLFNHKLGNIIFYIVLEEYLKACETSLMELFCKNS